jgi:hypothetical protein
MVVSFISGAAAAANTIIAPTAAAVPVAATIPAAAPATAAPAASSTAAPTKVTHIAPPVSQEHPTTRTAAQRAKDSIR